MITFVSYILGYSMFYLLAILIGIFFDLIVKLRVFNTIRIGDFQKDN